MNTKLRTVLAGVTAAVVLAGGVFAASSASAEPPWLHKNTGSRWNNGNNFSNYQHVPRYYGNYGNYGNYGYYDDGVGAGILGFIAGAFVGNTLSRSYDANSCYRFRTYNPATGMYMSYHGPRHCP